MCTRNLVGNHRSILFQLGMGLAGRMVLCLDDPFDRLGKNRNSLAMFLIFFPYNSMEHLGVFCSLGKFQPLPKKNVKYKIGQNKNYFDILTWPGGQALYVQSG